MDRRSIFDETCERNWYALRARYPGQAEAISALPPHIVQTVAQSGRLPPFIEFLESDNNGGYKAMTPEDAVMCARALVRLLE